MKTNSELQKDIINVLYNDPLLKNSASEIGVIVHNGTITLCGQVNSYEKKMAAENAVRRVKGVKVMAIKIEVVLPGKHGHTDTEIARAVQQALRWHMAMEDEHIQVKVEDGWVYLEGMVSWHYQKTLAEEAIENLADIKGIINLIGVDSREAQNAKVKEVCNSIFAISDSAIECITPSVKEIKSAPTLPQARKIEFIKEEEKKKNLGYIGYNSINKGNAKLGFGKKKISGLGGILPSQPFPKLPTKKRT